VSSLHRLANSAPARRGIASYGTSATLTSPRWLPVEPAPPTGAPWASRTRYGCSATEARTCCTTLGRPRLSASSWALSSRAFVSMRRTAVAVSLAGVPSGIVRNATTLSASTAGKNEKRIRPVPTYAATTSRIATAVATVV
jgi:hypothetical protein